jgi:hypothetical protein
MTYHLEIICAEKGVEEGDQVCIHGDAHFTPECNYVSTKTKSLTLHSAANKEDMTVTIMLKKIYDIADIKDSRFILLESEDSRVYVLRKKMEMKEVCTV